MAIKFIDDTILTAIANAIRTKLSSSDTYKPSEMATAIGSISGGITPTGTKSISITANGTTTEDVTSYASASITANVPNSYAAGDEGKVVSNGALVSQSSDSVTQNGTVDTTLINSLTVNVSNNPNEVPSGYTQLKYLESSGTQAINTNVAPTLETKFQVKGIYLSGNGQYYTMGGCSNPPIAVGALTSITSNSAYNSFGDKTDKLLNSAYTLFDEPPTLTIDKTQAKYDTAVSTTISLGATAMSGNANTRICLFARGNAGNIERKAKCRIYRAKIWDDGTLIREFVPAIRNSDEVIGMYELVNDVFYTNVGTGVFVGGTY